MSLSVPFSVPVSSLEVDSDNTVSLLDFVVRSSSSESDFPLSKADFTERMLWLCVKFIEDSNSDLSYSESEAIDCLRPLYRLLDLGVFFLCSSSESDFSSFR